MDAFEKLRKQIETTIPEDELGEFESKLRTLFSSSLGREVLELLNLTFVRVALFVPGDPHAGSYNMGHADLVNYFNDVTERG